MTLRRPEVEKDVEGRLIKRCKEHGWYCAKFVSPARRGVPDRIVAIKASTARFAIVWFIELKAPNGVVSALQQSEHDEMRALDAPVNGVEPLFCSAGGRFGAGFVSGSLKLRGRVGRFITANTQLTPTAPGDQDGEDGTDQG